MNLQLEAMSIIMVSTSVALFFLLMRLIGGYLSANDQSSGASVGKALLNIFP